MQNIIRAALLSAALAGCSTGQQQTAQTVIQDVQQASVLACSFLPTAATIASILSANPAIATATQIAAIICDALKPKSNARSNPQSPSVTINGQVIPIHGKFVR